MGQAVSLQADRPHRELGQQPFSSSSSSVCLNMRSVMDVVVWFLTLRGLAGFVVASSSLSATSCSSSGVKSWVHCHDFHPSVPGAGLTAAKPVFAGATDSSSLDSCGSVLGDAWEGPLPASARSSSCSRCWRLLSLGAIFASTIESSDPCSAGVCCSSPWMCNNKANLNLVAAAERTRHILNHQSELVRDSSGLVW